MDAYAKTSLFCLPGHNNNYDSKDVAYHFFQRFIHRTVGQVLMQTRPHGARRLPVGLPDMYSARSSTRGSAFFIFADRIPSVLKFPFSPSCITVESPTHIFTTVFRPLVITSRWFRPTECTIASFAVVSTFTAQSKFDNIIPADKFEIFNTSDETIVIMIVIVFIFVIKVISVFVNFIVIYVVRLRRQTSSSDFVVRLRRQTSSSDFVVRLRRQNQHFISFHNLQSAHQLLVRIWLIIAPNHSATLKQNDS
jgi:hypothetical protein